MKVGIGLPNAVPDVSGADLTEFARRAEAQGFSSLGTIDRVVYGNYEPLVALAAAAVVTERIELITSVMLGPLRLNAVQTAKQALSVNQLSGGRLTLGIGLGARGDDYEASGVEHRDTGKKLDTFLDYLQQTFDDPKIGPDGAPLSYKFHHKNSGRQLQDQQSLADAGVEDGHILRLQPEITAG